MSTTALTNIQEVIERTLFEKVRQELVDKGYLPDVSTFADTVAGWELYKAAINAVVISKGYSIELFGAGVSESRGIKKVPRIVINSGSFLPGALGGDPRKFFIDNITHFSSAVTPPQTADFYVDLHLVANSIKQMRILNSLLALAIPRRGYAKFYNDAAKSFFIRYISYYDADIVDEGIIEKVFGYEIPDCWDREDIAFDTTIAKIEEITLNTNVQKYLDGTWGTDSTPLIIS